ncbi:hypothetical protein ADL22_18305 [Streptomyces sp. NRRL F-4489]|uniref:hypothetical protein n=1 Tax=Streptomyces sp. NRRL F-4489 TaxID=1609095 RepID=UPI00074A9405|nr:hypothetical protein [Streptomyces sp. NRRL F-4489]KUL38473.1 hypothetical protein ADL22_18305 [Streptomyces sp. NRRL F-4489]
MTRRKAVAVLAAGAELLAWWAVLTGLWMVLISSVDTLEGVVGGLCALLAAFAARGTRRASGEP